MKMIHNVDAFEFISKMPDQCVDAVITDPPYDTQDIHFSEFVRVCRGAIIMFCAPLRPFFTPQYLAYWEKPAAPKNVARRIGQSNVEWILIGFNGKTYNGDLFWSNYTGVFHDELITKPTHPFEKPVSLMERLISIYTNPGDIVFDPFFGSGSTLRAAINLGRQAIGCEINKEWFDKYNE
jgi:DNA modification methylase